MEKLQRITENRIEVYQNEMKGKEEGPVGMSRETVMHKISEIHRKENGRTYIIKMIL